MQNETKHTLAVVLAKQVLKNALKDIDYLSIVEQVGGELEGLDVDLVSEISSRVEVLIETVEDELYLRDYMVDKETGKKSEYDDDDDRPISLG